MQPNPRTHLLKATLTAVGALALVGSTFAGTAFAHDKEQAPGQAKKADTTQVQTQSTKGDHDGDADRLSSTHYTEDNDTNDGGTPNNVADAGDNRHPSGKDRSVEHGGSGTQGKAESTPDQNGKGPERDYQGTDKPNGTGGIDKADQDGNNGCGNDDDFEDDNEGWCGRKPHKAAVTPTTIKTHKPSTTPTTVKTHKPSTTPTTAKPETCPTGMVDTNGSAAGGCTTPSTGSTTDVPCPTGMIDVNGSAAGGCTFPSVGATTDTCPVGMVDVNGTEAGGCTAPGTTTVPCPAGMVDLNGAESGGCFPPAEVLSNHAVAAPAAAEVPGEVLAAEAVAPAAATVTPAPAHRGNIVAAAASGALAFTGSNLLSLLAAALMAIAIGWFILRADRKRNAA